MLPNIDISDILLSTCYIFFILLIAIYIKRKKLPQELKKYFIPFILFKISCSIAFVLIHIYYYKGGDTFLYFTGGKFLSTQFLSDPSNFFRLYFGKFESLESLAFNDTYYILNYLKNSSVLFTCRITSLVCFIGFNKFLTTSILFSVISSIGIWYLFKGFCRLNKESIKIFAIGTLFFPTLGIWGSGILKDPLTIASIGILFYCTINIVQAKKIKWSIAFIVLSIIICISLKPYILYIFIPSILLWVQSSYIKKIKNPILKIFFIPFIISLFGFSGYYIIEAISSNTDLYSLENLEDIAKGFQSWHTYLAETRGQSGYSLGEFEFNTFGIIKTIPAAIFVTYFRPLPFEVLNIALALESIESMALLVFTLVILFKNGPVRLVRISFRNKEVLAYLTFSLLFGITVGLTSYNFGALSRYKLPAIPFFIAALAIIYNYKGSTKDNSLKKVT